MAIASAAASVVMVGGAAPAFAAPTAAPVPLEKALTGEAKDQWEAGRALYRAAQKDDDYTTAFTKFQRAYTLSNDPRLLWPMAVCQQQLKHWSQTSLLAQQFLTDGDAKKLLVEKDRNDAKELLKLVEPYTSNLSVQSSDVGVNLILDSTPIGTTPLPKPVLIDAGKHVLHASKAGMKAIDQNLDVAGGGGTSVALEMVVEKHQGTLIVDVNDGALIQVDGRTVGSGHSETILPSGPHTLHISAKGKLPHDDDNIVIQDDTPRTLAITLEDRPSSVPAWVWIGGGVLVAGGLGILGYELFKPGDKAGVAPSGSIGGTTANISSFRFH